jgi:hypothetical protein
LGSEALFKNIGSGNVASGTEALKENIAGNNNVATALAPSRTTAAA